MIFSRGNIRKSTVMFINNSLIERVDSFCYFQVQQHLSTNNKNNVDKAKKAIFKMRAETSGHELEIQTKLHLFDSIILPMAAYFGDMNFMNTLKFSFGFLCERF